MDAKYFIWRKRSTFLFKHLNGQVLPLYNSSGFAKAAALGANVAGNIDNNETADLTDADNPTLQSAPATGAAINCKILLTYQAVALLNTLIMHGLFI